MFAKSFYLDIPCAIIIARNFEQVFLQLGGYIMNFKQKIIELIDKCSDDSMLELIYRFCKKLIG